MEGGGGLFRAAGELLRGLYSSPAPQKLPPSLLSHHQLGTAESHLCLGMLSERVAMPSLSARSIISVHLSEPPVACLSTSGGLTY